jgi:hypothetical protein
MCVQCTLPNALQVLGVASDFDFDVAAADAPWMNALEDGVLSVTSRRSRTPVQAAAPLELPQRHRDRILAAMTTLEEMGMIDVYGAQLCTFTVERCLGDVGRAVEELTALAPYTLHRK